MVVQSCRDVPLSSGAATESVSNLCHRGGGSRENVVIIEPLGDERDDRDPQTLPHNLGLQINNPAGQPLEIQISANIVYERKKRRVERVLQQLVSSINYGDRKDKGTGGRRGSNEST